MHKTSNNFARRLKNILFDFVFAVKHFVLWNWNSRVNVVQIGFHADGALRKVSCEGMSPAIFLTNSQDTYSLRVINIEAYRFKGMMIFNKFLHDVEKSICTMS